MAKSAATLLCLVADELVLGDVGELGPLDAQCDERQQADRDFGDKARRLFAANGAEKDQRQRADRQDRLRQGVGDGERERIHRSAFSAP